MRNIRRHYDRVASAAGGGRGEPGPAPVADPCDRARLQGAPADASCARLRKGVSAQHPGGRHRQRRRRRHGRAAEDVGRGGDLGSAQGARVAGTQRSPSRARLRARVRRKVRANVGTVYIPEYVVGHWWEQLLHNQRALRLKGRLLFTPGVMVTFRAVPAAVLGRGGAAVERPTAVVGSVRRGPAITPRQRAAKRQARSATEVAAPPDRSTAPDDVSSCQDQFANAPGGAEAAAGRTMTVGTHVVKERGHEHG